MSRAFKTVRTELCRYVVIFVQYLFIYLFIYFGFSRQGFSVALAVLELTL